MFKFDTWLRNLGDKRKEVNYSSLEFDAISFDLFSQALEPVRILIYIFLRGPHENFEKKIKRLKVKLIL